jgi:hypothetical protein
MDNADMGKVHVAKCQYAGKNGHRYRLVTEASELLDFESNDYDTLEEAKVNAVALGYNLDDEYVGVDYWMINEAENRIV